MHLIKRQITVMRYVVTLILGTAMLSLAACGGGSSNSNSAPSKNPMPVVSSLSPASVTAGTPSATLTVHGSEFIKDSVILFAANRVNTQYVSSSELEATIPTVALDNPSIYQVQVTTPAPGGGTSSAVVFTVTQYAQPAINSISPDFAAPGSSDLTIDVQGSGFSTQSAIMVNNNALGTSFVSTSELKATIPANDMASVGTDLIQVMNPYPAGNISQSTLFPIGYSSTVVQQSAADMVDDSNQGVIYFSVPDTAANNPNTISALDPATGNIVNFAYAGSKPDRLALSSGDTYIYVGIDGANSVKRFTLPGLTADLTIPLGSDSFFGPYYALDIAAAPSAPHTIAVSLANSGVTPAAQGGVVIYDDATARPNRLPGFGGTGYLFDSLQWGATDADLYAANNEDTGFDFYTALVDANGVTLDHDYGGVFNAFFANIHYLASTNLVYSDGGQVINPNTGTPAGSYPASGIMVPEAALGEAFFVGQTQTQFGGNYYTVESFDLNQYTPIASITIGPLTGNPLSIVHWGSDGLAVSSSGGQIYLITGQFVKPSTAQRKKANLQPRILYNTWQDSGMKKNWGQSWINW
jgi:hypothetical protein